MGIPPSWANNTTQSAIGGFDITPSDTVDLAVPARALYIGGAGAVKVTHLDGSTVTYAAVAVGVFPVTAVRVFATGTGASNIKGMI